MQSAREITAITSSGFDHRLGGQNHPGGWAAAWFMDETGEEAHHGWSQPMMVATHGCESHLWIIMKNHDQSTMTPAIHQHYVSLLLLFKNDIDLASLNQP